MLSISIVLYKTPVDELLKCLSSFNYYSGECHFYFIDNSPSDILRDKCVSNRPFSYIHLHENPGYGAGHNVAIRDAQSKNHYLFHLVINADVFFDSDVISPMIEYMKNNPAIGQVMPKILNIDGSLQYLCKFVPSPADLFYRRFLPRRFREYKRNIFEMRNTGYNKIMFVPYLSGCFMLLRHESLKFIGLFDERFFIYPEDIDLTRRMAEHYCTIFYPQVAVTHQHGAASYKSLKMLFIHTFNIIKYFNKWGWFHDRIRDDLNSKAKHQFGN